MNKHSLLLVDDSIIHNMGMKFILSKAKDIDSIYEANTVDEALNKLELHNDIDTAIIDISINEEDDGFRLTSFIGKNYPKINCVILSHNKEIQYVIEALKLNVSAYLAKDSSPETVLHAIYSAHQGQGVFFGDTISRKILMDAFGNERNIEIAKPYNLTENEILVLGYIAKGYSVKEISLITNVTINTIETYKERIKTKLGVGSIIEAVVWGIKHKFIS